MDKVKDNIGTIVMVIFWIAIAALPLYMSYSRDVSEATSPVVSSRSSRANN